MSSIGSVNSVSYSSELTIDWNSDPELQESVAAAIKEVSSDLEPLSEQALSALSKSFVYHIKYLNSAKPCYEQIEMGVCLDNLKWIDFQGQRVLWLEATEIGSGSDCSVHYGITLEGILCAVKQRKSHLPEAQWNRMARFLGECSSSTNVVHVLGANGEFIVEEYLGENLDDFLKNIQKGDPDAIARYRRCIHQWNKGILQGLADIHALGMTHSDIKLENVLIGQDEVIKFSDFGYAVKKNKIHGGTSTYYAPEQIVFLKNLMQWGEKNVQKLKNQERIDVWGGMLVLAKMDRQDLSPPFATRLHDYEIRQVEIAYTSRAEAKGVGKARVRSELENYAQKNVQYFKDMVNERKKEGANPEGLFSDLKATSALEMLLIEMSHFDPAKRISSAEALALYQQAVAQQ